MAKLLNSLSPRARADILRCASTTAHRARVSRTDAALAALMGNLPLAQLHRQQARALAAQHRELEQAVVGPLDAAERSLVAAGRELNEIERRGMLCQRGR